MGNSSQDPDVLLSDSLARGYFRVRFQQGKPVLDRELTLAADLASPRRLAARYLGDGTADADSFSIVGLNVAGNDFGVRAGRCLVGGLEAVLGADTSYRTQPLTAHVAPLPVGPSNVYLRVSSREVGAADDPSLQNAADVGFETARRDMVAWEVVVSVAPIAAADHFLLAVIDTAAATVQDRRRSGLSLAAAHDEIAAARGQLPALAPRLDTALAPDGTLKPAVVGTTALANLAVTEPKLADGSVSKRALANGAVPIVKLASSLVASGTASIPAAVGTTPGTLSVTLQVADQIAFYWVGVHYESPKTTGPLTLTRSVTWQQRVTYARIFVGVFIDAHRHEIVFQNPNGAQVNVTYKAYRVEEA